MIVDVPLHAQCLILGFVFGVIFGTLATLKITNNFKSVNYNLILTKTLSVVYVMVWVYWHIKAAQGQWEGVPSVFDIVGGVTAGTIFGYSFSEIGLLLKNILPNINKPKK